MIPSRKKNLHKLFIFHNKSNLSSIKNKFYSKSHCFRAVFSNVNFKNVNFKGAILTKCSFKDSSFFGVDFIGTNIRGSNFTKATFKNCLFVNALIDRANFKGCVFEHCVFVNTNLASAKNLVIGESNTILKQYPKLDISTKLKEHLERFKGNPFVHNSRVLHIKGGKLNHLTLKLLLEQFGEDRLIEKISNLEEKLSQRIITLTSLRYLIDKA